jgi:hypothetical protein
MKKVLLPLLLLIVSSHLFSQKIDIDDDYITLNKTKVATIVSTKKFDSFYVKDLNNTMKFIFCIKTNGAQDHTRATWFQVINGDQTIYTDIIPQKFRMFKMKLGIAEELVFQKLITEQGFNEDEIKTFFATKRRSYTDELNAAGLAQKIANEKVQKYKDSMEVIYNRKENIDRVKNRYKIEINGENIINKNENNLVIGMIVMKKDEMTSKEYLLIDLNKTIVASCKKDWKDISCTRYDGYTYTFKEQFMNEYLINSVNETLLRDCNFMRQLREMKEKELEILKKDFYCGMDVKQKFQGTAYFSNGDTLLSDFDIKDFFEEEAGTIIKTSGDYVFRRLYLNEKGKERAKGYVNSDKATLKVHTTNCKYISTEVPAKPSKDMNIGIGSVSLNLKEYDFCKEIYKNKKYTILNCVGIPAVYVASEGIAYRAINNELENFLKTENKNNEGKNPLSSFDYETMIKWAKQFDI